MIQNYYRRRLRREANKTFFLYLLIIISTISIVLNILGSLGKLNLPSLFADTVMTPNTTEKEIIRDTQIEYIEKEVPYYFDNEGNEWKEFTVTAYTANDPTFPQGTNNIVASGFDVDKDRVSRLPIAASNCIPLYSIIEIEGLGPFIILDRGLGYKTDYGWEDENWIDIMISTSPEDKQKAFEFGRQKLRVRVVGSVND